MPKISIILAVYNVENYLRQGLDSLVNQTLKDIEIICVNDGSTDGSLEILNEYASKDNRVKVINQENQGPGVARNNAIKNATGDYIMIMDSDDWYEPDACELCYNQITANKNDFVTFNASKYYEKTGKKQLYDFRTRPFKKYINNPNIKISELDNDFIKTPYTWAQIYSREFIIKNEIKYTEETLGEDLYFWIKAIISADTFSIIEKPIYNYRIRQGSATADYSETWHSLFYTRYRCLEMLENTSIGLNYMEALIIDDIQSFLYWYKKLIDEKQMNKGFYNELRKIFLLFKKKYKLDKVKKYVKYELYEKICNTPWYLYLLKLWLKKLFSVTKTKTHRVIILFGIKFKIKRSK